MRKPVTTKILLKSLVSTILEIFMCADINDFYYNTSMLDLEYMKPTLGMFTQEIVQQYNLKDPVTQTATPTWKLGRELRDSNRPGDYPATV